MDKIEKALRKFSEDERKKIKEILSDLRKISWKKNLDIKKLKGRNDIYRIRKGNIRIIFRLFKKKVLIISIERRKSNTYK